MRDRIKEIIDKLKADNIKEAVELEKYLMSDDEYKSMRNNKNIINDFNVELERKNFELQEYKNRLDASMLSGNIAWRRMNVKTGEVIFNEQKTKMLGYKAEYFTRYQKNDILFPKEKIDKSMELIKDTSLGERWESVEIDIENIDGSFKTVLWNSANIYDTHDKLIATIAQGNDITERKIIENEILKAKEEAEIANKAKSQFLANTSREIRNPLNGVIGFIDLLKETKLSSERKDYIDDVKSSAELLLEIINDILDFSKIEAGKLELDEIKTDIVNLLNQTISIVKNSAVKKGLDIILKIQPDIPSFIVIDPIRLKQVLVNLLSNAIKFTVKGETELSLEFSSKDLKDQMGTWTFRVKDTGIGVNDEQVIERKPDLVFMDIQMPIMDGYTATKEIRHYEKDKNVHTTIVALTATALTEEKEKCFSYGMDDYIAKPVNAQTISGIFDKYLFDSNIELPKNNKEII